MFHNHGTDVPRGRGGWCRDENLNTMRLEITEWKPPIITSLLPRVSLIKKKKKTVINLRTGKLGKKKTNK